MADMKIKELFALDISRPIEEVIKVDQDDEQIVHDEIAEYIVTDTIRDHFRRILDKYAETPNKKHEGIGIWVSGFFGSGKSSFAKMLGLALENRRILGKNAGEMFGQRTADKKTQVLLTQIAEQIPTDAVIFDLSTDRGIRTGNQTITEIMYRLFLKSLGYASDLDLAELEITLEIKGELEAFKEAYAKEFNQAWDASKDLISFSLGEASAVMHKLYPTRYATPDSWLTAAQDRTDITAGKLAERCKELMERRRPKRNLVFVIDEVGQFVARDVQKMLDLQGVVQSIGRVSHGNVWLIVTSQEKLTELVSGLDNTRVELARLMDRFPTQVHLEPSDISEVTSKRVLSKNADAEKSLGALYKDCNGRLTTNTRLSADVRLPELSAQGFVDLYPLLPYQIDLIIEVVSGLRTQGGASRHVGGANRTIIKLAQQLLIHDAVGLANQNVGALARIDQIYDLVEGNIPSEIRGKISGIKSAVAHPMAQSVAKAICLLQYVQNIHRTAENIAATLHRDVAGDSCLSTVKEALEALVASHQVRLHDGQYRIPTPAEDDWEVSRAAIKATAGDFNRLQAAVVTGLWEPKPTHVLAGSKTFRAGLTINGRSSQEGDIRFNVVLADAGSEYQECIVESRTRSQHDKQDVFWVASIDDAVSRATAEVHRSKEMLARMERGARTRDETALVSEEKVRLRHGESELRRLMAAAMLSGAIFFRGNDRSPDGSSDTVAKAAGKVLGQVLPDVYHRFGEGAARVTSKDLDTLVTTENLRGLTAVFTQLHLIRDEGGQPVFITDSGPLKEVLDRIENRAAYGEAATGKYLVEEFDKEPFGWELDTVRLFLVSLVRAGMVKAVSKGTVLVSATTVEARNVFASNNLFRACSFQKQQSKTTIVDWIEAQEAFKKVFGKNLPSLDNAHVVGDTIRKAIALSEETLHEVHTILVSQRLPGDGTLQDAIDQTKAIRTADDDDAILTFNANYQVIKDAIKRAAELKAALTGPVPDDLRRARRAVDQAWRFLQGEPDLPEGLGDQAVALEDKLAKETFYRELADIELAATDILDEYDRRYTVALDARVGAYAAVLDSLKNNAAWGSLNQDQRDMVSGPLARRATRDVDAGTGIPFLRSELDACDQHYKTAVKQMMELVEGNLLVSINIAEFFADRIESPEQLEGVLGAIKQRIEKLLGEGKKILVQ